MIGKITAITRQKGDKLRASIFIEEEFAVGVNEQTIEEFRLRKGDYIDADLADKILDFDYWIDAKRVSLRYLNHRSRSAKEIRERLHKEEIPEEIITRVLEFLRSYDLVNDEKWSRAFANDKLGRKLVSSRQLAVELKQKGIDGSIIEETLKEVNAGQSDADRALEAAKRRLPRLMKETPEKRKQKMYSFLAGRGFNFDIIKSTYQKLSGVESEEVEESFEDDV
jgi:regulatory protein